MNPVDKHNSKTAHIWDLPEPRLRNNSFGNRGTREDLVTQDSNDSEAKECLIYIRNYINKLCGILTELIRNPENIPPEYKKCIDNMILFCETQHYLKELGTDKRSKKFLGICIPREIVHKRHTSTYELPFTGRIDSDY